LTDRETDTGKPGHSVSEDELHAYVDNQLDAARLPVADLYLDEH
jgi:hypothetical protein